jgi:hypothetical protein
VFNKLKSEWEFTQRRIDHYMQEAERLDRQMQALRELDPVNE